MAVSYWPKFLLLATLGVVCYATEPTTVDLGGAWSAKEVENTYVFPATVPGGVYTDLMKTKILDDVFYGYNDENYKWVGQINWTYFRNFQVDDSILAYENVNLVFEGVDTFAEIIVNDVTIGHTQNMFVKYVFDVKKVLKTGNNTIVLNFQSPVEKGRILNDIQMQKYRIPWLCPADAYRGECHINMLRKMQASFSWDWGPSFASMGIWKPVYLEAYDTAVIEYLVAQTFKQKDENWNVTVDVYLSSQQNQPISGNLHLDLKVNPLHGEAKVLLLSNVTANEYGEFVVSTSFSIDKTQVQLWWPNGYGEAKLSNLTARFSPTSNYSLKSKSVKIGFRTVELVQDELSQGRSFYFKINGVPIFMKGSNEIPINILPEHGQQEDTIRYLLQSAKDVHMNMLRVWGGGVYESDAFYSIADELGILIWQDFMFACSLYPSHEEYLSNVIAEVRHNVKRIYSHPSIVVYSGNNENEGVLANNWYGTQDNYTLYKEDYVKLYINTVKSELDRLTHKKAVFISSSPTNGIESESEGYVAQNPGDSYNGDVHFYNYASDPWNANYYPIPRFSSEYGYQSLPSVDAWMTATNDSKNLSITGEFMDHRQHHPQGNDELKLLIDMNLLLPSTDSKYYDAAFILYSQIYAAQAIKVETEHYRRYRSILDDQGQGYTMGALYWQLNDVWVAPTWSGIDFLGNWKMLHYFAKDFFAPIIVTGFINNERQLQIYTVSDELETQHNHTNLIIKVYKYNDPTFTSVSVKGITTNVLPSYSHLETTISADDYLATSTNGSCGGVTAAKLNCFYYLELTDANGRNIAPNNYVFPAPLTSSNVPTTNVTIADVALISSKDQTFRITLISDNIALFVWLDSHIVKGKFNQNGFLITSAMTEIIFTADSSTVAPKDLLEALTVTHLRDPMYFN